MHEAVDGLGRHRAHPEAALEQVGPGPEVSNGAQVFQGVALFLQRIVAGALAHHREGCGLELKGLFHFRGQDQFALGLDGGAHPHAAQNFLIAA